MQQSTVKTPAMVLKWRPVNGKLELRERRGRKAVFLLLAWLPAEYRLVQEPKKQTGTDQPLRSYANQNHEKFETETMSSLGVQNQSINTIPSHTESQQHSQSSTEGALEGGGMPGLAMLNHLAVV